MQQLCLRALMTAFGAPEGQFLIGETRLLLRPKALEARTKFVEKLNFQVPSQTLTQLRRSSGDLTDSQRKVIQCSRPSYNDRARG